MSLVLAFVRALLNLSVLRALAGRILVALGIGAVTYVGFGALVTAGLNHVVAHWQALPASMVSILALGRFDDAVSVILSACATRLALMGLDAAGALRKVLWRPGQQGSVL